jgi:hypothetical protein
MKLHEMREKLAGIHASIKRLNSPLCEYKEAAPMLALIVQEQQEVIIALIDHIHTLEAEKL